MPSYRLYCLDSDGQISFAEYIEAEDDGDAVRQARSLKRAARKCEVWQGNRLVASLDTNDLATSSGNAPSAALSSPCGSEVTYQMS